MERRQALLGIAGYGAMLVVPSVLAQRNKPPLIGILDGGERLAWWAAFKAGMRELGYVEGKTFITDERFARNNPRRLATFAEELVRIPVDVIVTTSTAAALAAKRAADSIPIVMATGSDHVSLGLAETLARPGGNVTGMSTVATELTAKRFELLRELHPRLSRLGVLWHRGNVGSSPAVRDLESLARGAKVSLHNLGIGKGEEVPAAFAAAVQARIEALYVILSPLIYTERQNIVNLALKHRMSTMHGAVEFVELGGLASYGANYPELHRRAAGYVDKILKGAKPGDLPIEEPDKFDLAINLKTAKALGMTIPQRVLLRAARVVD